MAVTARKDWDRLTNALASGNVVSGANTLSGNVGKDVPGVAPNKVTQIQFGANAPIAGAGGRRRHRRRRTARCTSIRTAATPITRLQVEVGDVTPDATDVFTYTLTDKNGASSTATLTIEVLPETLSRFPTARAFTRARRSTITSMANYNYGVSSRTACRHSTAATART